MGHTVLALSVHPLGAQIYVIFFSDDLLLWVSICCLAFTSCRVNLHQIWYVHVASVG